MGFFSGSQQSQAQNVYSRMRSSLAPKDGMIHVVMVTSFSKLGNQNFDCDTKYTTELDFILSCMQREGYQILDVKFNSMSGQGLSGGRTGFNTLITYR